MRRRVDLPQNVLSQLPEWLPVANAEALGNHGGFSGASLWRIRSAGPMAVGLRCWPAGTTRERVERVQRALLHLKDSGVDYVPAPLPWRDGATIASVDGRTWEMVPWLDGEADYHRQPNSGRLAAAAIALARIHRAWACDKQLCQRGKPDTIQRRWRRLRDLHSGGLARIRHALDQLPWDAAEDPQSNPAVDPALAEVARRLLIQSEGRLAQLVMLLDPIRSIELPLQLCIRDIWHDHVLFVGDAVTGIVDFDAIGTDTVATDLARLLGSLVGDRQSDWQVAVDAYRNVAPLSETERDVAGRLDQVNVVLNVVQWLEWIYVDRRSFENGDRVRKRVYGLARRLEDCDFLAGS